MWTRHKNHMVWTDPWVYVALPDQEIEYFQMRSPKDEPHSERWSWSFAPEVMRVWRLLKTLAIL